MVKSRLFEWRQSTVIVVLLMTLVALMSACSSDAPAEPDAPDEVAPLELPTLTAIELGNDRLQVVATTSIIGDIVGQVGAGDIDLTILMTAGQDPHAFEPAVGDLTDAAQADLIFINGWDLEEGLITDLENVAGGTPLVPVSAGIAPLPFGQHTEDKAGTDHNGADPHTWLDPHLTRQWVANITQALSEVDPANAGSYAQNASAYLAQLDQLIAYYDEQVVTLPAQQRRLVTNHDSFGYFARAYDFEVIGTVIPAASTLAEPSAGDLANLLAAMDDAGVCTIFAETTSNEQLAEVTAAELTGCDQVRVITLHTGTLSLAGGGAESYLELMRTNIDAIVDGLR